MELQNKIIKFLEGFLLEEMEETIELTLESKLFGGGGPLDSMGLVNMLVDLEQFIEDEYDITITLADEKAMSRRVSPFSRVSNLINYIQEKLKSD